jgi:hypothetical protein
MKLKYSIVIAITLVVFAVFGGCNNPFSPPPAPQTETAEGLANGEGGILLSLNGLDTQRTILPATVLNDFVKFDLTFTSEDRSENYSGTRAEISGPLTLLAGMTWDLTATGYISDGSDGYLPAATGSKTGIVITAGQITPVSLTLKAISDEGEGTLAYTLSYPDTTVSATMTITPLSEGATPAQTLDFMAAENPAAPSDTLTLVSGYYRVTMSLTDDTGKTAGARDILHVYKNLPSVITYAFTPVDFSTLIPVTSGDDNGPGTLRQALADAKSGDTIEINEELVITLTSALSFIKAINLTIEGGGATLTQTGTNPLLRIYNGDADVAIRRLHFKDGNVTSNSASGSAIDNVGALTLESCIFSGNQTAYGGAIGNGTYGTLTVRGCTFYNNSAGIGGAIFNNGKLTLTGNVFYGNSATSHSVVRNNGGTVTSGGYNVANRPGGITLGDSGWVFDGTDVQATTAPIGLVSFKPLSGLDAAGRITTKPEDYPTVDFYGNPIPASGAQAGAVQELTNGFILEFSANDNLRGSVSAIPAPDSDGVVPAGPVAITASPNLGYDLGYWLVNGNKTESTAPNTLNLNHSVHTVVQAVFTRTVTVTSADDSGVGTLRDALTEAQSGDTIEISEGLVITLTSQLSLSGAINLTIEGGGATLTQTGTNRLLYISNSNADVTIRRLHFKDGNLTLASAYGGAIDNNGTLTLESCIFSGNRTVSTSSYSCGGAIYNDGASGSLTVRGCTFYNNIAIFAGTSGDARGGAIFNDGTLSLTGNVFYGNSATYYSVVCNNGAIVTTGGYNVSDKSSGIYYSGWTFDGTDVQATTAPIGLVSLKPRPDLDAAGRITTRPENYPTVDFYGNPILLSGAHAGAVQELSGYSLNYQAIGLGSISVISGTADADGFYVSGSSVTLRVVPVGGRVVGYWKVNGEVQTEQTPANEITLTMYNNKTVEAYIVGLYIEPVTQVDFGANSTATVSFPGLANRSVFLVKVNKGDTNVAAADSGSVVGASSLPLTNLAPSFALSLNADAPGFEPPLLDHPGAMVFNANPPPITDEMRREPRNTARSAAPLPPSPAVGDIRMFWVEASFDKGDYVQKQATLRATGAYGNVWVMDDAYSVTDGGTSDLKITTAQAEAFAQKFDLIYPVETKLLGYEYGGGVPDTDPSYGGKDGDLKVQILVYDFGGGGAAGFFHGKDFYTGSYSNLAEIFYLEVLGVDKGSDYMYSALVHEFQHMINFNQKRVKNNQASPSWYNEMLSLMAEDVISPLIGVGPDNSGHPIKTRTGTFLDSYNTEGIAEWGFLESNSYAKGFAFGAYLMRNWGGAELLSKILANNSVDIPSITAALDEIEPGMTFEKAVQRYGEALIFSGATKSADVLSFDNTVEYTFSGTTYTAFAFDIWTMGGPKLFPLTDTSDLKAYGLIVQSADAWKNKTGDLTITLNKPVSPNVELYLMVR